MGQHPSVMRFNMEIYEFSSLGMANHSSFHQFRRDIQVMIKCLFIAFGREHKSRVFSIENGQWRNEPKERILFQCCWKVMV